MSVDSGSTAFAAADTSLNSPANEVDIAFDSTPTRSSQTISHIATFSTAQANFTIRRIALHNDTTANVSTSSNTLVAGIDGQSLTKSTDFSLQITFKLTYSSV